MIKAIVFDVDDTLYDTKPSFVQAFEETFNLNIPEKQMNDIFSNFTQQEQLAIAESNSDSDLKLSDEEINFHSLHHTFKKFDLPGLTQETANAFAAAFETASNSIHLFDGLTTVFNTLTTKFKLGIITNGSNDVQLAKIMKLKLHHWFNREQIITSEDAKRRSRIPSYLH